MSKPGLNGVLDWLRRRVLADVPCGTLLERFLANSHSVVASSQGLSGDEAFAELVRRHGPKVYGVCRRILGDHQLAEDAFQATFVVLSKKANTIHPRSAVGGFLYGVARKAALKALAVNRRRKETLVADPLIAGKEPNGEDFDVLAMLDEEIADLSDAHRAALVMCELDGVSRPQAAKQLGIKEGTLSSRLASARKQLRNRLHKRGVALSAGALAELASSAQAAVPLNLTAVAAAIPIESIPPAVAVIAQLVLRTMVLGKLKSMTLAVSAVVLVSGLSYGVLAAREELSTIVPPNNPKLAANQHNPDPRPKSEEGDPVARPKSLLAVLPFEERGPGVTDYGTRIRDLLSVHLTLRPELQLIDRSDLNKVLEDPELDLTGAVKADDATRFGHMTGAKIVVTGSVLQSDKKVYIIAKLIGTETSRVLVANVEGQAIDELAPLVEQLGNQVADIIHKQSAELLSKRLGAK